VSGPQDDAVEVLSGRAGTDLRFVVVAYGNDEDLYTLLRVFRGERTLVAGSGFGGAALPPGSVLAEWRGQTEGLPFFVMARTSPAVDRVVATTDRGTEVTLALSPLVERFGLRFAAAALPDGERPAGLRAERDGTVLQSLAQRVPPRRRGGS